MSAGTSIEWTDVTWNPTRGCSRVSEGCRNCYAERMAARNLPEMRSPTTGKPFAVRTRGTARTAAGAVVRVQREARWTGAVELIPSKLDEPLHWRKPRRIFVNSMSDLFHESLPDIAIAAVFAVMETAQRHTFQILTKRPERMLHLLSHEFYAGLVRKAGYDVVGPKVYNPCNPGWPLPNVWLGVSVEDQATADERIPLLLQTPASVRWVSYEPGLGPINFSHVPIPTSKGDYFRAAAGLHWIVVGGESGPGARPFDVAWARSTVRQCKAAGVPVFYKQGGSSNRCPHSSKGGHFECFPPDVRVRQFPA